MSIYGGFGTRAQESTYNKAVYNLLYLMQLKISRNNKQMPFDEHRFQQIFTKLYNRLFIMEDTKYLPPKYSYSMKDLAVDYGVFERTDVSSVISGSTNLSMTTTSGFNQNFNEPSLKDKDFALSYPLSPIREQRGPSLGSLKAGGQQQMTQYQKYGSLQSNGGTKNFSQSLGAQSRFKNPMYNNSAAASQQITNIKNRRQKRTTPRRERIGETNSFIMQQQIPAIEQIQQNRMKNERQGVGALIQRQSAPGKSMSIHDRSSISSQPPTTINNNNIVININKNYNAQSKLKQVQEESLEDPDENMISQDESMTKTTLSKKLEYTPMKRDQPFRNPSSYQPIVRSQDTSLQGRNKYIPQSSGTKAQNAARFNVQKMSKRKLRSLSPREGTDYSQGYQNQMNYQQQQNQKVTMFYHHNGVNPGGQSENEGNYYSNGEEFNQGVQYGNIGRVQYVPTSQLNRTYGGNSNNNSNQRSNPYNRKFVKK